MRFGISTYLYGDGRLARTHLVEIAEHGFGTIELVASPDHFDYQDPGVIATLGSWLSELGLGLHALHVSGRPPRERDDAGATYDPTDAIESVLGVARTIPTEFLIVHLGRASPTVADGRDPTRRALERLAKVASPLGLRVAVEVDRGDPWTPESMARLLDDTADGPSLGICLNLGHAFLAGDVVEAIEVTAEHLVTTHVHDNHAAKDEHLVPFEGDIEWPAALMALQKIGYDGTLTFELSNTSTPSRVLDNAKRARHTFQRMIQTPVVFD